MNARAQTTNSLWAQLLVDELLRNGCDYFCISPGSRSAPLTLAAGNHPGARCRIFYDERGAAFHALGYARATGRPAVLISTSGTAVANYLPAVIEASLSFTPMLLLTADRPPELRESGANQTIDQVKLFGGYVRWHTDLPCPDLKFPPNALLATVDQALFRAVHPPAGPVHVNCMFREPLAPVEGKPEADFEAYLAPVARWAATAAPYSKYTPARLEHAPAQLASLGRLLNETQRGLVILGEMTNNADSDAVLGLCRRLGWPVFPDIASGLRLHQEPFLISYFDLILLSQQDVQRWAPEVVLQIGGRFISRRLQDFLQNTPVAAYIHLFSPPQRQDPQHLVTQRFTADISSFCRELSRLLTPDTLQPPARGKPAPQSEWLASFQRANARVAAVLAQELGRETLSEPGVARSLAEIAPAQSAIFCGNSMPIRDMAAFAAPGRPDVQIFANRGASGIDGNAATAAGLAAGTGKPVSALLGDLAALHDLNSLAHTAGTQTPIIYIIINNGGGGIFSFLPVAAVGKAFETFFGTPHDFTFEAAAAMFHLGYAAPRSLPDFRDSYGALRASGKPAVIEIRTDRQQNFQFHQHLQQAVRQSLSTRA